MNYKTTQKVMILVRLATCLIFYSYLANNNSPVSRFVSIQELAEMKGAGLSRLKYLIMYLM